MRHYSLVILSLLFHASAFASPECDWAIQVAKDVDWRISHRNATIAQLKGQITAEQADLQNRLIPLFESSRHAASIYDFQAKTAQESQAAVTQALDFIQRTIVSNAGLQALLDQLKDYIGVDSDRKLSDQIRAAMDRISLRSEERDGLQQIANAVALVESSQADWRKSETELLQVYLNDRGSLVNGLFGELSQMNQRLASDLSQLAAGHAQDLAKAEDLARQVQNASGRLAADVQAAEANVAGNNVDIGYAKHWDPTVYCPREDIGGGSGIQHGVF